MSGGLTLAAPASGSGKTVLTLGLLRHLARTGHSVASAKAGPDYIDPCFHAAASASASRSLTGRVGESLRPGPNGTPYSATDSQVAAKFFNRGARGYEDARSFVNALGGSDRARAIADKCEDRPSYSRNRSLD